MSALGFVVVAIGIFMVAVLFLLGMFPRGRSPHLDLDKELAEAAAELQPEQTKPAATEPTTPPGPTPTEPPS